MKEIIIHNGIKYVRYPRATAKQRRYFKTSDEKHISLHRVIYEEHHGPIPKGWVIHHIDGNITNNDPRNLKAMTRSEHSKIHLKDNHKFLEASIKPPTKAAINAAAEWHRSKEGKAWHKKHGKASWKNRNPQQAICQHCGSEYESLLPKQYCTDKCRSYARKASGVDDVSTTCKECGNIFKCNKYQILKRCSDCRRK